MVIEWEEKQQQKKDREGGSEGRREGNLMKGRGGEKRKGRKEGTCGMCYVHDVVTKILLSHPPYFDCEMLPTPQSLRPLYIPCLCGHHEDKSMPSAM